ncbi:MAG: hypothetical protein Q4G50_10350 [Corynebacterium sp.]|uniref:hypothetical protein n=1 Tax=Corynebacterium sp. TaxID=1720 RepID=UPI0026E008E7|nr:hypothetical protein [Corynebacterium sp.]MDO5670395.1 hypothetical protein [Corynebacterium sp.]
MTQSSIIPLVTNEEVSRRMEFADAALAAAGHEVTDPRMRAILAQAAREELDDHEVVAALRELIQR